MNKTDRKEYILVLIFAAVYLPAAYVVAAMASLNNDYFPGTIDFVRPFRIINSICFVFMVVLILIFPFLKRKNIQGLEFLKKISKAYILVNLVVYFMGYMPCLVNVNIPGSLDQVLQKSLLCPSYSNRSVFGLYLNIIAGICVMVLLKVAKTPNKKINQDNSLNARKSRIE